MPTTQYIFTIKGPTEKGYPVHLTDDVFSHYITKADMEKALKEAESGLWKDKPVSGITLGQKLYGFLNGTGGVLSGIFSKARTSGEEVKLCLTLPYSLNPLPFELIYQNGFILLSLHPGVHLMRTVTDRNKYADIAPAQRQLKILFMACCPHSLADKNILDFEKEEELIFQTTEKYPVDITTEDSGSIEGLHDRLYEEGKGGYDIVHITGHGIVDPDKGPLLFMETETGEKAEMTPDELWECLKEFPPRVLFVSGCQTGKSDKVKGKESFAFQMVKHGVPVVLSWGLSVEDKGATILAAKLYEKLAMGLSLDQAVHYARKETEKRYHPWPLLRIFTDGSPTDNCLIEKRKIRYRKKRDLTFTYMKGTKMKVLKTGFVGRRRQIQKGIRALRGKTGKYGALITGTAGLGKSCLAGKFIERFKDHALLVIHGTLETSHVITRLKELFEKQRKQEWVDILISDKPVEERIKDLCALVFPHYPIILCLDDFEQNLERTGNRWVVQGKYIPLVSALLSSAEWSEGNAKLIITSRYAFVLEKGGINLAQTIVEQIPLSSFRGADLRKKQKQLESIDKSEHTEFYMNTGKGNPRLLEWLDEIAARENEFKLEELKKEVEGKSEEFINSYLADILARTEGEEFHVFLQKAAVYRIPVPGDAFTSLGDVAFLSTAVNLTLMETEEIEGREPVFWVTPVIREMQFNALDEKVKEETHRKAYEWYDSRYEQEEHPDPEYPEEAVFHALACGDVQGACKHAVYVGGFKEQLLLYREKVEIQGAVAERITKKVINDAIKAKDGQVPELLNELGLAWDDLGDYKKAIDFYNRALENNKVMFGEKHPNVAVCYNNLGSAWQALGENQKAIDFFNKALEIFKAVYGEKHPQVAVGYNNLGGAWYELGEYQKAIDFYNQALEIDQVTIGEKHPNVAIRYNNLGMAWQALGENQKAISFFNKTLEIFKEKYGEKHPQIAAVYNNLGLSWQALGENQKAIDFFNKALEIDRGVFGEKHPDVAIDYNNIGNAWYDLGDKKKAIDFFNKALGINLAVFGEKHPKVAIRYNNLGGAWQALGEYQKAIDFFNRALEIFMDFFGPDHPYTKSVLGKIQALKQGK